jgi:tetratricopeptide (TPR) repeat protein
MKLMDMLKSKTLWLVVIALIVTLSFVTFAKSSDYYYVQGVIAFNAGDYAQAEKYLKTALMLNPALENNSDIKYMIGLSAWYAGDMVTARAYLPSDHISAFSTSTKNSRRDLVADIARWESRSSEIIKLEKQSQKKKISRTVEWLIFFSFLTIILGGYVGYKYLKHRKKLVKAFSHKEEEDLEEFPLEIQEDIPNVQPSQKELELPSDAPGEDEIKIKLQNLLNEDVSSQRENVRVIEEPEKVIEKVGKDATQEEIEQVEEAIHELLSKDVEKSAT